MNIPESEMLVNAFVAILSGSVTASIAKFYIGRSVNQLDDIVTKIAEIKEELSGIKAHLVHLEKIQERILEHESKIAVLDAKLHSKLK